MDMQWDKALTYILFAYREVPTELTGFSPFEMLYGRKVRGPLDILGNMGSQGGDPSYCCNVCTTCAGEAKTSSATSRSNRDKGKDKCQSMVRLERQIMKL